MTDESRNRRSVLTQFTTDELFEEIEVRCEVPFDTRAFAYVRINRQFAWISAAKLFAIGECWPLFKATSVLWACVTFQAFKRLVSFGRL